MDKRPTMLLADDVAINRAVLARLFRQEYNIAEVKSGAEAVEFLEREGAKIVLLSLSMEGGDGLRALAAIKRSEGIADIPIVATASKDASDMEARAMEMGAADFVQKPFNPLVVRRRVRNVMARPENEWLRMEQTARERQILEMRRYMELDSLTGIYNRETFYKKTAELLRRRQGSEHVVVYLDINCFKVINDLFHVETGNLILRTAATYFKSIAEGAGLCGRMEADHFALCMPKGALDMDMLLEGLDGVIVSLGIRNNVLFYAGIYPVENAFLPVDQMCDRARMAMQSVKGRYRRRYAYYDREMREALLEEQMMLRDMEPALAERQFMVYAQPVYSLKAGRAVSAEALMRWAHPMAGLIAPNSFIPLFERNGFVVRLDRFAWEAACKLLHRRKARGLPVVPMSVNVSRLNFYDAGFYDTVLSLLERYDLDASLLKLEITETAYTDNPAQLINAVKKLRLRGFKILMDDFGSGYSSLNMLKDVPVDVLKVDMNFVRDLENSERAAVILRRVVEMARDLGMDIIVEGVETGPQVEFLSSIGCDKIQGYWFAKPMPTHDFERLLDREAAAKGY